MTDNDNVVLSVPARAEFARTVRLAGAELAARAGMCIDDVDDVRLAVDEAFLFATERAADSTVTFSFTLSAGSIEMLVGPVPAIHDDSDDGEQGERYARFILESICDEYEAVEHEGGTYIRLVKRSA